MTLWRMLDGGLSLPSDRTLGQRLTVWCGRRLATRHASVTIPRTCLIHPEARIYPRSGTIQFGDNCTVAAGVVLQGSLEFGDNCSVQAYSVLVGYGTDGVIRLGNDVRVAPHVMMIAANHVFDDPAVPIREQGMRYGPIIVEDDVWIGGRATLVAGITVGTGAVVGAGAVVTRDVPPFSIVAGVPAKVIGHRGTPSL